MDNLNQSDGFDSPIKTERSGHNIIIIFIAIILISGTVFSIYHSKHLDLTEQINLLPMYGGVEKTPAQIKADADFIDSATKYSGGSKEVAAANIIKGAQEFTRQGDYLNAMKRFNQAWLLDPDNSDVYKGYLSVTPTDQFLNLHKNTEKVLAQNPNQATIQCFLGVIHTNIAILASTTADQKTDYLNQGKVEFQKGLATNEANPFCQLNFAANLYYAGEYQNAWDHLVVNSILPLSRYDNELTLAIYSKDPVLKSAEAYNLLEFTYQRLGQTDDAFRILQKAVQLYPSNVSLICDLGAVYTEKWYKLHGTNTSSIIPNTFIEEAQKYLERGIRLDPSSASCHGYYVFALYDDNRNKLDKVWPEIQKAKSLGWVFDQQFLNDLQEVYPEPKN